MPRTKTDNSSSNFVGRTKLVFLVTAVSRFDCISPSLCLYFGIQSFPTFGFGCLPHLPACPLLMQQSQVIALESFSREESDSVAPPRCYPILGDDSRRSAETKSALSPPDFPDAIALTPVTATGATARILNPARVLHSARSNPALRAQM